MKVSGPRRTRRIRVQKNRSESLNRASTVQTPQPAVFMPSVPSASPRGPLVRPAFGGPPAAPAHQAPPAPPPAPAGPPANVNVGNVDTSKVRHAT